MSRQSALGKVKDALARVGIKAPWAVSHWGGRWGRWDSHRAGGEGGGERWRRPACAPLRLSLRLSINVVHCSVEH